MGWMGRSLGDFGAQLGEAKDINQRWQDQLAGIKLKQAQLAQEQLMNPLRLKQLQGQLEQDSKMNPLNVKHLENENSLQGINYYTTANTDGSTNYHMHNALDGSDKILHVGEPQHPKYEEFKVNSEGILEGYNPQTGKVEPIPGASKYPVPGAASEQGFTGEVTDAKGNRWGVDKKDGVFKMMPSGGAKFPVPHEGGATELNQDELGAKVEAIAAGDSKLDAGRLGAQETLYAKQHGIQLPPISVQGRGIPPGVLQSIVNGPMPSKPSPAQSLALAAVADKVFGGGDHSSDLKSRGRIPGRTAIAPFGVPLRTATKDTYEPPSYPAAEYKEIVDSIRIATGANYGPAVTIGSPVQPNGSGKGAPPPPYPGAPVEFK